MYVCLYVYVRMYMCGCTNVRIHVWFYVCKCMYVLYPVRSRWGTYRVYCSRRDGARTSVKTGSWVNTHPSLVRCTRASPTGVRLNPVVCSLSNAGPAVSALSRKLGRRCLLFLEGRTGGVGSLSNPDSLWNGSRLHLSPCRCTPPSS